LILLDNASRKDCRIAFQAQTSEFTSHIVRFIVHDLIPDSLSEALVNMCNPAQVSHLERDVADKSAMLEEVQTEASRAQAQLLDAQSAATEGVEEAQERLRSSLAETQRRAQAQVRAAGGTSSPT
jgi:ElaB/YqjD/DUF883 family membrane-anchored ribosome-binding protein